MNVRISLRVFFVFLATAIAAHAQESRDHVVIVLDCSGSMNQRLTGTKLSKMDAAKTALKAVLQKVPQSTQLGLIVFGLADQRQDWIHPLGSRNDAELSAAIDRLQPSSGTPLGAYIKKGTDRLLAERQKQFGYGTYRLLVVTDGEAQDQDLVNRFTPEVIARGITVDVIGVGMKQDHTLATKVHSYRRANDPESFQRAISEVFAEITGTARDATQAEAFELLAPIPAEVASSMIQALSASGNHPIGARPSPPKEQARAAQPAQPKVAQPAPSHPVPVQAPAKPKRFPAWLIIVGVLVLLSFFGKRGKGARR